MSDPRRRPLIGSGGASADPWVLLTRTDQGVSPYDSGGYTTAGTGFDAATGRFTWVFPSGITTQLDGFKEALPRWTVLVSTLYSDFDLSTDILDLAMRYDSVPLSASVEKFGCAFGLMDRGTSDIANLQGVMFGLYPDTVSAWNNGNISATQIGSPNTCSGTPNTGIARFDVGAAADELRGGWRIRNASGVLEEAGGPASAPQIAGSALRIHVAAMHRSAVGTAGATVYGRVYHRRIRTGGLTGLPA